MDTPEPTTCSSPACGDPIILVLVDNAAGHKLRHMPLNPEPDLTGKGNVAVRVDHTGTWRARVLGKSAILGHETRYYPHAATCKDPAMRRRRQRGKWTSAQNARNAGRRRRTLPRPGLHAGDDQALPRKDTMTTIDITKIELQAGGHTPPPAGTPPCDMCFYEAYNYLDRGEFTASCPPGVSRVLHTFGMRLNDRLPHAERQFLKEFLPRAGQPSPLDGTATDGLDTVRAYMAADWAIRTCVPAWLDLAGLQEEALSLRGLTQVTDPASARAASAAVYATRDASWARRTAAFKQLRATHPAAAAATTIAADAAAAAAAADAAAAAAAADAAADADAAAAAAADAAAAAAADAAAAAADAAAAAAADAAAAAADAAAAGGGGAGGGGDSGDRQRQDYSEVYTRVYQAAMAALAPTRAAVLDSAVALYRAMIRPVPAAS